MITIERASHFEIGRKSCKKLRPGPEPPHPVDRVPRISRLMALAIRFDRLLRNGVVANQAELARLGKVSPPRMTQIMNLLNLAPDIQGALLFLPATKNGRNAIAEHQLRADALTP